MLLENWLLGFLETKWVLIRLNSYCDDIAHRPSILQIALVQGLVWSQGLSPQQYSYTFHQQVAVVGSHSSSGVHAEGHNEPAPTSAPWRMDGKWWGNSFLLGSRSLANHGG
jgi:hypothetical protein